MKQYKELCRHVLQHGDEKVTERVQVQSARSVTR